MSLQTRLTRLESELCGRGEQYGDWLRWAVQAQVEGRDVSPIALAAERWQVSLAEAERRIDMHLDGIPDWAKAALARGAA